MPRVVESPGEVWLPERSEGEGQPWLTALKPCLSALAVPRGWRVYDAFARNLSGMRAGMEAGRGRGALALASAERHGLCVPGHPSKVCASVSPPMFGDRCCPTAGWLHTWKKQRFEDFSGKPLGKCSLPHGKELKMLIFKEG